MCGESFNPTIHLQLTQPSSSRETDDQLLERVADECRSNGVAVVVAKYLNDELKLPPARWDYCMPIGTISEIRIFYFSECSGIFSLCLQYPYHSVY